MPKSHIFLKIFSNDLDWYLNPLGYLVVEFWVYLFNDYIREIKYLGTKANIDLNINIAPNGIYFEIEGFNDSMKEYLN